MTHEELIAACFDEAADRVIRGKECDPVMAVTAALCMGEKVPDEVLELLLRLHIKGPWVQSDEELKIFAYWCTRAGTPLQLNEATEFVQDIPLYRDDHGDCCLIESARGHDFAMWTRKSRLYVGFAHDMQAELFRVFDPEFSMESTGNKRLGLVVIDGGDTPDMIMRVGRILSILKG